MSRQYFAMRFEFPYSFYQYINIVSVGKKCREKELIFIWILGQVDEWEGERAYINIISFCKDCEYPADSLLWVNQFA